MAVNPNIFLIGPMGAGKTTIGRRIAEMKGMQFADSDQEVEQKTGVDISFIFDMEGEAGFRNRERDMIERLSEQSNTVIATGGGAVTDADTRDLLSARGVVVYLQTSIEQQLTRTRKADNRPMLDGVDDVEKTLRDIAEYREPLYNEIADIVVASGQQAAKHMAREVVDQLEAVGQG